MENTLKKLNVLYVEDDLMIQEEIIFSLETLVGELWVANNGKEGEELFYKHLPDLIITDIQMPLIDGFTMIEHIQKTHPKIPVIIMTAFNDTQYLLKAIDLGIRQYVTKPVNLKNLMTSLNEISEHIHLLKKTLLQEKLLEQYKAAIDMTMSVSKMNLDGTINYINEPFTKLSGYTFDEMVNNSHEMILSPNEDSTRYSDLFSTLPKGGVWRGTFEKINKNGNKFFIDATIFPLCNENGDIVEYMSIAHDVTELFKYRNLLEIKLRDNEQDLAQTLNYLKQYQDALQLGTAVCHMSLDGNIIGANKTFCSLLGYTTDTILTVPDYGICKSEGFEVQEIINALREQTFFRKELMYSTSEGKTKIFNSIFVPIRDLKGDVVEILSMHHDINELLELNKEIVETQHEVLVALGEVAEKKSEEVGAHVKRVAAYSSLLAKKYGLSNEDVTMVEMVAPIHDVGKIAIPDTILNKPAKLTVDEMEIIKEHTTKGHKMLSHSQRPLMKHAAIVALEHHEKYDGTGYPRGLKGEDIHIFGRIVAVADVFDSLSEKRVYKEPWSQLDIVDYFKEQRGLHFDPCLVDILLKNIDEFNAIKCAIE